jgi:NAD(P)-dependent dehydrogenase (short-subunit alcohol dehydrogenase family)
MPSLQMKPDLRVLVTAGASGIGRAITEVLAANGARVHICDVNADLIENFSRSFPHIGKSRADVSDPQQVEKLFAEVGESLGGLDVLVNNAGIAGPTASVDQISLEDWRRTMDVNLNGTFYCARLAVPLLRQSRDARIINMSSVAGRLGYPLRSAYAATKWGIIGMTKSLAMELGSSGICVNAVLPGIVEGSRMRNVIDARAQETGMSYDQTEQEYLSRISLRRMVTACDVAAMVLFLCSPAGANISGQSLSVCGNVESLGGARVLEENESAE